jgi:DNA replicative helicase MCM subunit Mcm2 (Cdc46/Mcm family)
MSYGNIQLEQMMQLAEASARAELIALIEELINKDFGLLVHLLYRVDVDEEALKKRIREENKQAPEIIADMIIVREQMKKQWKARPGTKNPPDTEW